MNYKRNKEKNIIGFHTEVHPRLVKKKKKMKNS